MPGTYPQAIKVFPTFHDYTDVIFANSVNEIHDEVVSVEQTLGINPFQNTAYPPGTTFSFAIQDLFINKAPVDHKHDHHLLDDLGGDDHLQYIRTDGTRPFTGPVAGVWAQQDNQLVPLGQLLNFGYINTPQAEWLIGQALTNLVTGAWGGPAVAPGPMPSSPSWRLTGGVTEGVTTAGGIPGGGYLYTNFAGAFHQMVQAFVANKLVVGGSLPAPPFHFVESQMTLMAISTAGATVMFSHDYGPQSGVYAKYSWIAIGY